MINFEDDFDYDKRAPEPLPAQINALYELRHFTNVYGVEATAERAGLNVENVGKLRTSSFHGSLELAPFRTDFVWAWNTACAAEGERDRAIIERERKRQELLDSLSKARESFAGIGTRKAKIRLNKLTKSSVAARAIRLALEIEDKNISAKLAERKYENLLDLVNRWQAAYVTDYSERIYEHKHKLILELCDLARAEGWTYGIGKSDSRATSHVIYFDLPGCAQISWHFSTRQADGDFPEYPGQWDELEGSTLVKLETVTKSLLQLE